jgi:hypothetical protein
VPPTISSAAIERLLDRAQISQPLDHDPRRAGLVIDHHDPAVVPHLRAREPEQHRQVDHRDDVAAQAEHARQARRRRQRELLPAHVEAHEPQRSPTRGASFHHIGAEVTPPRLPRGEGGAANYAIRRRASLGR